MNVGKIMKINDDISNLAGVTPGVRYSGETETKSEILLPLLETALSNFNQPRTNVIYACCAR